MNRSVLQETSTQKPALALARLAEPHGYRLEGDNAHLHARFAVLDHIADERTWALQLWACPNQPSSPSDLAGQIVAEVALPAMSEVADETEHVDMSAFLRPPAGRAEHWMALVLASGKPGQFNEIHDLAVYPRRQRFVQPAMRGTISYRIEGTRVHISAEHIENPREAGNRSGSLALELWALAEPYAGGAFQGVPLAGVAIGSLSGQAESPTTTFELPFSPPPTGKWHFVMMLREWTTAGYVTRDFINFNTPFLYRTAELTMAPKDQSPISAKSLAAKPPEPTPPAETASLHEAVRQPSAPKAASDSAKNVPVQTKAAAAAPQPVSVNRAAEAELSNVEGLSPQLARAIIRKRPFSSLEELRRVRGITAKLVSRLAGRLGL
jgi:hypothetical protein